MLAGWIWSSSIGCGDRISRPCATASRSDWDGNRPVERSGSAASAAGNRSHFWGSIIRASIRSHRSASSKPSGAPRKQWGVLYPLLSARYSWRRRLADGERGMQIRDGFIGTIGNTPLIKLRRVSEMTGCTILGKAEFLNPGGSVKDRPARHMILEAEKRGELQAGGVVVESTAGNTGIGLALVADARGYRTVIVIPETQSQEKKDTLRLCGAELIEVPAVPYRDPNNYVRVAERLA